MSKEPYQGYILRVRLSLSHLHPQQLEGRSIYVSWNLRTPPRTMAQSTESSDVQSTEES